MTVCQPIIITTLAGRKNNCSPAKPIKKANGEPEPSAFSKPPFSITKLILCMVRISNNSQIPLVATRVNQNEMYFLFSSAINEPHTVIKTLPQNIKCEKLKFLIPTTKKSTAGIETRIEKAKNAFLYALVIIAELVFIYP